MLARDEDSPSVRNSLILLPDFDCVGGGLGRAFTVPGVSLCCPRFAQIISNTSDVSPTGEAVDTESQQLNGLDSTLQADSCVSWPIHT